MPLVIISHFSHKRNKEDFDNIFWMYNLSQMFISEDDGGNCLLS